MFMNYILQAIATFFEVFFSGQIKTARNQMYSGQSLGFAGAIPN